jgi:hypothetical protein
MRELFRAKGTKGYTSGGAVDRPDTATFKPLNDGNSTCTSPQDRDLEKNQRSLYVRLSVQSIPVSQAYKSKF